MVNPGSAILFAFAAMLGLSGCGGRPEGVLIPVSDTAQSARKIDILVATTRSSEGAAAGQMFTGERGPDVSFADIRVSVPNVRTVGEVQWPEGQKPDPEKNFVTVKADRIDRTEAQRRFHQRVGQTPKRRVLIFVHGYNTKFEEAVYRFAQIVHDSDAPVTAVLFTWPSRGRLLAYNYDRESANYSRDVLETILKTLSSDSAVSEISILAHSMGNWVTMEALRQMAIRDKKLPSKIKNIMMAAPDVDVDVFRRQIASLPGANAGSPFTLFVSQDDSALAVSRQLWGGTPRLGSVDPKQEPYKSEFAKSRMQVIDLTEVQTSDKVGHGKFAESPEVVQMIGRRLASGQDLSDGKAGLGDKLTGVVMGATGAVGSAASMAIHAPLAIVDPSSREAMGEHFEEFRSSTGRVVRPN